MSGTQKPANSTTAKNKTHEGFTGEERAAMKDRAQELKPAGRRCSRPSTRSPRSGWATSASTARRARCQAARRSAPR